MNFYERYKMLCSKKGLKPQSKEIMTSLGVSSGTITGWSKGAMPDMKTIQKIADYFKADPGFLMGFTDLPFREDLVQRVTELLRDCNVEVYMYDDYSGEGPEYVLTYNGVSRNYQDYEYRDVCVEIQGIMAEMEVEMAYQWIQKTFNTDDQIENTSISLITKEEQDLLDKFRQLDDDGKIMLQSTLISELRRIRK